MKCQFVIRIVPIEGVLLKLIVSRIEAAMRIGRGALLCNSNNVRATKNLHMCNYIEHFLI